MPNLIAYIPVINRQYLDWLAKHNKSLVFLMDQSLAESLNPVLTRNLIAVSADMVADMVNHSFPEMGMVCHFSDPEAPEMQLFWSRQEPIIMPDEDICHTFAERYLYPKRYKVKFEEVWGRWDMTAVKRQQPVIPDVEVSVREIDIFRTKEADGLSRKSPDWWRQIGVTIWKGDKLLVCGWNKHLPTEYEAFVFGDPRLNFEAGDPDGMDAYISLHAEEYAITFCANNGILTRDTSMYINTFPCGRCARVIAHSGVKELFFREGSSFLKGFEILRGAGVRIVQVKEGPVQS